MVSAIGQFHSHSFQRVLRAVSLVPNPAVAQRLNVPVVAGGFQDLDACPGSGEVVGLDSEAMDLYPSGRRPAVDASWTVCLTAHTCFCVASEARGSGLSTAPEGPTAECPRRGVRGSLIQVLAVRGGCSGVTSE